MTIKQALPWGIKKLKPIERASHGDIAAFDAPILLAFVLDKPKEFLYIHPEKKLTPKQLKNFEQLIARRGRHEPVAHLTEQKDFFGLNFYVNKNVMIPRPETEILVEETIKIIENCKLKIVNSVIVDVGTGSGCIAVSLAKHLPTAKIFATEISKKTLNAARKNARFHHASITFLYGNLLEPIIRKIKSQKLKIKNLIVVANLPYLATRQWQKTQPEIKKYEPRLALDGGKDGLKYHKQLFEQIKNLLQVTSYKLNFSCLLEIDPSQVKRITKLIRSHFPTAKIQIKKDLARRDRIVIFKLRS